ncbi:MAG: hypothetical protein JW990_05155 [Thermoleophilia bacterium]|nr:hypothetical protein [Thermoleophilia bacterium]
MDDDFDDDLEPTYEVFRQKMPSFGMVLPIIVLIVVVAVVAGLVWGGIIQGDESRVGPRQDSTTEVTVQIVP